MTHSSSGSYTAEITGGTKNPLYLIIGREIGDAIYKARATDENPAEYWDKETQEKKLQNVFDKYDRMGGIWTAKARAVRVNSSDIVSPLSTAFRSTWSSLAMSGKVAYNATDRTLQAIRAASKVYIRPSTTRSVRTQAASG